MALGPRLGVGDGVHAWSAVGVYRWCEHAHVRLRAEEGSRVRTNGGEGETALFSRADQMGKGGNQSFFTRGDAGVRDA